MRIFTARPQKIIGNIALASLIVGVPAGILLAVVAGVTQPPSDDSLLGWAKQIISGMFIGPCFVFVAGLVLITPILSVLRYLGFGGPFFVYLICIVFSGFALNDHLRFGWIVVMFSIPASYVFCRYAYRDANRAAE